MSAVSAHPRLPLVYATPKAIEQAVDVVPGVVLENAVRDLILDGRVVRRESEIRVAVGDDWVAVVRQSESPARSGRRSWCVIAVRRRHFQAKEVVT